MTLNTVLARLQDNIIPFPYASEGRIDGLFSHAKKVNSATGLQMPLLQINGPRCIRYLSFDVDRRYAGIAWDDANLPIPNIICTNPANGHAHLIYEMVQPIWLRKKDDQRPGEAPPVRYLKAVLRAMGKALRADPSYSGLLVKNPFHASWITTIGRQQPYTLAELSRHLEFDEKTYRFKPDDELLSGLFRGSRYVTLFEIVRKNSYKLVRYHQNEEGFKTVIGNELNRFNLMCDVPLPKSEIRDLQHKITRWTWIHLHEQRKYKINALPSDSSIELMRKGQAYQAQYRRATTMKKILIAIRCLSDQGKSINKSSVALLTGMDRKTVRSHWEATWATLNPPSTTSLTPITTTEETECLRHLSSGPYGAAAAPRQVVPVCKGQLPTPLSASVETYEQIVASQSNRIKGVLEAIMRARELASIGILLTGLPEYTKQSVVMPILLGYYQHSCVRSRELQ